MSQPAAPAAEDDAIHRLHLRLLREISPSRRLQAALEWSEMTRTLFRSGLRRLHPDATEEELTGLYLKRLKLCHNRNS